MICVQCGGEVTAKKGSHQYCAADGVEIILEGVLLTMCASCGEEGVIIPKMAELNRGLAAGISQKSTRLSPGEIRFLRKYLGWSGADFAQNFGVRPETVSRWENGSKKMSATAERLLRLCALQMKPVDKYPLPRDISETTSAVPLKMSLDNGWSLCA